MAYVSYQVPVRPKGKRKPVLETRTGVLIYQRIGDETLPFVLQDTDGSLAHYGSGQVLVSGTAINARLVAYYVRNPYSDPKKPEDVAKALVNELILTHGAEKVLATIHAAPIVNPTA